MVTPLFRSGLLLVNSRALAPARKPPRAPEGDERKERLRAPLYPGMCLFCRITRLRPFWLIPYRPGG